MRVFFSVGEPSGDLHASNLIRELQSTQPNIEIVGFGGQKMKDAGCQILFDLTQLAVMFLSGAITNLRTFLKLIGDADKYFSMYPVDAVVLIDYPGFNWWIARKAKKHGIPVFYYGVPQMWAWAPWRIRKIRKFVDYIICKLPFEQKWFAERGCKAEYVGHPYFDQLHSQTLDNEFITQQKEKNPLPLVLLLPGSRKFEVERNLATLIAAAKAIRKSQPKTRIALGCFNESHKTFADPLCRQANIETFSDRTQELMTLANSCIACSGSVSLELLYHRIPSVIVYKISLWKLFMQMFALNCKFITLPNLMHTKDIKKRTWWPYNPDDAGAEPVLMPEYLTWRDRSEQVASHISGWLSSEIAGNRKRSELDALADQFAKPGATSRAASYIIRNTRTHAKPSKAA